jgi:hypothetical protein
VTEPVDVRIEKRHGDVDRHEEAELVEHRSPAWRLSHLPRNEQPRTEQTEDRTGCPNGDPCPAKGHRQQPTGSRCCQIQRSERRPSDLLFEPRPEQVEGVHIEEQVHQASMKEGHCEDPIHVWLSEGGSRSDQRKLFE